MNTIVVGCGRVGAELATRLFRKGHQVIAVDYQPAAFGNLPADFRGRTVEGEVLNKDVLRRAGIEHADALAAATNDDMVNAVVAHVARTVYGVKTVVARNYDPRRRPILEAFGLQVVSSSSWGAQRMEGLLSPTGITTVFSAGNGEVEVIELQVPSTWEGHTLAECLPGEGCQPVALTRAGRAMLPSNEVRLEGCDVVHLSATEAGIEALKRSLSKVKEG